MAGAGVLLTPSSAFAGGQDVLVKYRDAADRGEVRRDAGVVHRELLGTEELERVSTRSADALQRLEDDPRVLYAEPNGERSTASTESLVLQQWSLNQINVPDERDVTI